MPIHGQGLAADGDEEMEQEERVIYVLHPNYAVDDAL